MSNSVFGFVEPQVRHVARSSCTILASKDDIEHLFYLSHDAVYSDAAGRERYPTQYPSANIAANSAARSALPITHAARITGRRTAAASAMNIGNSDSS